MTAPLRLVIFDVDGTLVDSQVDILAAMHAAFAAVGAATPARSAVLGIVGLSLDVAMAALTPDTDAATRARMVDAYKSAYMDRRAQVGADISSPLYPGAREMLACLDAMPGVLLGIATGKSKRGLDKLLEGHAMTTLFATRQVADFHPSKPHPSMILQAMTETGARPAHTVMIGDTSFDMEMAANAGVAGLGVNWGYHGPDRLGAAARLLDTFDALIPALEDIWAAPA